MADINNPIVFEQSYVTKIDAKMADPLFTHKSWSSDDLQEIRSAIRKHYRGEQNARCAYCRNPVSIHDALNCHVEHIVPKSKYPDFIFEPKNLCVICSDCNSIKRSQEVMTAEPDPLVRGGERKKYPRASSAFLIVHPHFDRWDDHIQVFGKFYADKTEKGHFTIGACVLNRRLREFGWEPTIIDDDAMREAMTCYLDDANPLVKASALMRLMRLLQQL